MSFSTYAALLNQKLVIPSQKTAYLAVDARFYAHVLRAHVQKIRVDADWYVDRYADVRDAIASGTFDSAAEHYAAVGFYEHRMPHRIDVDEDWYVEQYPDVKAAVAGAVIASATIHFEREGFREGRFPHPGFRLSCADRPMADA